MLMDANKKAQIQAHARAIAALLYEETDPEQVKTLAGIEEAVREHLHRACESRDRVFFIETSTGTTTGRKRSIDSILGRLSVSEKQAQILDVKADTRSSSLFGEVLFTVEC